MNEKDWRSDPEQVKVRAQSELARLKMEGKQNPYVAAYFDSTNPGHDEAVRMAAMLFHLAEAGSIYLENEKGEPTLHPLFQAREEYNQIAQEQNDASLAKRGIKAVSPLDDGGAKGNAGVQADSVESLKDDPDFMKAYTDRYTDPAAHKAAVERMATVFQAAESGGDNANAKD